MGILEKQALIAFPRSIILDAIKMRAKTMRDEELKGAYLDTVELVKRICPHWSTSNAIIAEMQSGLRAKHTYEKVISMALRRLQDGLMLNRWVKP